MTKKQNKAILLAELDLNKYIILALSAEEMASDFRASIDRVEIHTTDGQVRKHFSIVSREDLVGTGN